MGEKNRRITRVRRTRRRGQRTSLAMAVSAALGASTSAWSQVEATPGGPTDVGPGTPGDGYSIGLDVSTNLTRNGVGLNRFTAFTVGADTHVKLNIPENADSLVNVVEGGARGDSALLELA